MKIKSLFLTLVLLALGGSLFGQKITGNPGTLVGGDMNASSAACATARSCVWVTLSPNASSLSVTLSGTWSATVLAEQSADGGNTWTTVAASLANGLTTYTVTSMTDFRVRVSAYTSGIASVTLSVGLLQVQSVVSGSSTVSPSPGVFNSNFDPPLFQNYSLTTTGAQTAINLTANPIDTHTLSWRLQSGGTIQSITDSFPYANGSLSGANASWVNQTGTFNVSSNVVYGSAAASLAYRSDGPTATANEYAQVTVVETVNVATQNHGPCVRVQTASQSGYCVQVATNALRVILINAGSITTLGSYDALAPVTGDIIKVQAVGTTISMFKNGVCLVPCGITDATFATGSTGIFSAASANSNGISSFQSGTIPNCTVGLDSSPDGVTWTPGGAFSGQNCVAAGSFQNTAVANYVRVNVTALTAGQTLVIVYSGRLAPAGPNVSTSPVSNGQWVNAGEVIWMQYTSQGIGTVNVHSSARIALTNGTTSTTQWDVGSCAMPSSGGVGTGFIVPTSGWLQGATTYLNTGGFPQGSVYINIYILNGMPTGGGTTSCTGALGISTIGVLLAGSSSGSSYPVSFVGTTSIINSPWAIPGFTGVSSVTSPSAGAEWSQAITTTGRTCIQGVSFQLITSAAAANRLPVLRLQLSTGTNTINMIYPASTAQAASLTQIYSFAPGTTESVTTGSTIYHVVPFNNGQLVCYNSALTTATISTLTTAIQAADQYSNIAILTQVQNDNN